MAKPVRMGLAHDNFICVCYFFESMHKIISEIQRGSNKKDGTNKHAKNSDGKVSGLVRF